MKKVVMIGCGAYMDSGYGCPGEWRCLKAAALGEGEFTEPSQVISFVKCECPGRTTVTNTAMALELSEVKPDAIHLSSCMVNARPGCPYATADEFAQLLHKKVGVPVTLGSHAYH